jgi:hypothetical protein
MTLNSAFLFGALAVTVSTAGAATRVFNLTGATAFRAASNNSIIAMLGGSGVTKYAFTGTQGISGSNRAIFVGTMPTQFPGDTIVVRTSWSGSTQGILDLADANSIQFLDDNIRDDGSTGVGNPVTTAGYNLGGAGLDAAEFENAVARWSFSDVDKLLSQRPNASLAGGPVGVVPFMFIAGEGSPAGVTNMNDQIHETLWSTGAVPASFFTGLTADASKTALATGRNNGSGTRATILAETQYGAFTNIVQYNATFQGTRTDAYPTGKLLAVTNFTLGSNDGHSSNSGVRDVLTRSGQDLTFGGNPVDGFFVSYLTISDALSATVNDGDSNTLGTQLEGARQMTYNGVAYSADNVKNGAYSLWGYQQLYLGNSPTAAETTFDARLRAVVPDNMGTAGIPIPQMTVTRSGGDGGPIFPNEYSIRPPIEILETNRPGAVPRHPDLLVKRMNALLRLAAALLLILASVLVIQTWNAGPSGTTSTEAAFIQGTPRRAKPVSIDSVEMNSRNSMPDAQHDASAPVASNNQQESDRGEERPEESAHQANSNSAHAKAVEFRRNLRIEAERLEDSSPQPTVLQPAAWVDLGDDPALSTANTQGIQQIAEELKEKIDSSGLDPASPEYRRLWNRAVRESDWKFRARYGARAWARHHIQAHHMATSSGER